MSRETVKAVLALIPPLGILLYLGLILWLQRVPESTIIHTLFGALITLSKDSYAYYMNGKE